MSKRKIVFLVAILLALTFLIRPGVGRLRTRILASISSGLGRQVDASSVNLRFLPQPGFDLYDFVVHDDPAFGAEPILRAEEVTASLRLFSILRGRLEIARLNLSGPSVNLVRNQEGQWNLQNLLDRAAKIPIAPTSKTRHERRPGFPYIEADDGRINLKLGDEKKPYALTNAQFAIWQDSENSWAMRLKAQPLRTDLNLSDTGIIRVNATWQRAAALRHTPLQLDIQWDHGQLGQLTKLIAGRDKGWRGGVVLSANVKGTPGNLHIDTAVSVDGFRRYDLANSGDLRLAAHCMATYDSLSYLLSDIDCQSPVGAGGVSVTGNVDNVRAPNEYDLVLTATSVPAQSLAALAAHIKRDLPTDLTATGGLDGSIRIQSDKKAGTAWEGSGELSDLHIVSQLTNTDIAVERIPLLLNSSARKKKTSRRSGEIAGTAPAIEVSPFHFALSKSGAPVQIQGSFSATGYDLQLAGDAQLPRLLQLARTAGVPVPNFNADGMAHLELQLAGGWKNFMVPRAIGRAQLHSITANIRGLNQPLTIASANLALSADQVSVQNISATAAGTAWHGSMLLPRPCVPSACEFRFDLHADELSADRLNRMLNPSFARQPWYRFGASSFPSGSYVRNVHASGRFSADRLVIRQLIARHVTSDVAVNTGVLSLRNLHADVLGGQNSGEWTADFTGKVPRYTGSGTVDRVALAELVPLMHDSWITGSASGDYTLSLSGLSSGELLSSAAGRLDAQVRNGTLPHILVREHPGPLEINRLELRVKLAGGRFDIEQGKLKTAVATYKVSGSSQGRDLNLKLSRDGFQDVRISGDLGQPHVSVVNQPETRAALKSAPQD